MMLFDCLSSFLESLRSNGFGDIFDADLCKGIIFAASNMSDEVLVSWYREVASDFLHMSEITTSYCDCDIDDGILHESQRYLSSYSALSDILAAMCFIRGIGLFSDLDS